MRNLIKKQPLFVAFLSFILAIIFIILSILTVTERIIVNNFIDIIIYALAFISLIYLIIFSIYNYKRIKEYFYNLLCKFKYTRRFVTDYNFRTAFLSSFSLILNLAFICYYFGFTIFNFSYWYLTLSAYYFILFMIREMSLYDYVNNKNKPKKIIQTYRRSGLLLLCLPILMITMYIQMPEQDIDINTNIHAYVMALITFYKLIMGSYNWFKARKKRDLITRSLRNINLTEALVSLLNLETTLITLFGTGNQTFDNNIISITNYIMVSICILIGLSMVIRARIETRKLHFEGGFYEVDRVSRKRKDK